MGESQNISGGRGLRPLDLGDPLAQDLVSFDPQCHPMLFLQCHDDPVASPGGTVVGRLLLKYTHIMRRAGATVEMVKWLPAPCPPTLYKIMSSSEVSSWTGEPQLAEMTLEGWKSLGMDEILEYFRDGGWKGRWDSMVLSTSWGDRTEPEGGP